ncbi:hypothetical protein [Planktotalea sp.]|uniref:hypothetical protein n=1 Tax=Planktotalea sp. TaxID=2029877 RepID=UPI0032972789
MKNHITHIIAAGALSLFASAAAADCTATYKAKKDNPLKLEHASMSVSGPCTTAAATGQVKAALAERGWTLLKVLSVSDK